jgi:hypothetical protein
MTGRAAADFPLTVRLSVKLRNVSELNRLLSDKQNPLSPRYHH